jgi:hypothetical protein
MDEMHGVGFAELSDQQNKIASGPVICILRSDAVLRFEAQMGRIAVVDKRNQIPIAATRRTGDSRRIGGHRGPYRGRGRASSP